jgi:signal transduction histidine kinase
MEIRKKIAYQYTLTVAIVLILAELGIYAVSLIIWRQDFYNRLYEKATSVAKLLTDPDKTDIRQFNLMEQDNFTAQSFVEIRIFDARDSLLYTSKDKVRVTVTRNLLSRIHSRKRIETREDQYSVLGIIYPQKQGDLVIVAAAIDFYGLRKLNALLYTMMIVFLAAMLVVYFLGKLYATRALAPILKVIEQVPAITEKSLHIRVDEGNGKDEIARLAMTFNRMLDRLEKAFAFQRNFIANASHELRTPLAYISGQIEVTLQKDRSEQEYRKIMVSVLEDLRFLNESTNKLLLLASASADSPEIPLAEMRIDEVLWEARSDVMKADMANQIIIRFEREEEEDLNLEVRGNEHLLKTAFVNLMENGCKYSADHTVDVTIGNKSDSVIVTITDRGIGIDPEEQKLIFEPFYRARNSSGVKGHGLGLPLVRQIILLHRGSIEIDSVLNSGTKVTVTFHAVKE